MNTENKSIAEILMEIYEIIFNDNISDSEALDEIVILLKKYNVIDKQ